MNKYFKREEFACSCNCGFATVDAELLQVLTDLRENVNSPITINSACRCNDHNKSVGGADGSKHKLGIAADIAVKGMHPAQVYRILDRLYADKYGIGKYDTFTHIDVRENKARW